LIEIDSTLNEVFLKVLQDHTAGDPMRSDVKWTNLSRRQIAGLKRHAARGAEKRAEKAEMTKRLK
jgi:hypothetical protein